MQIAVPAIFVLLTGRLASKDFDETKKVEGMDNKPLDCWSWVHHLAGWALGLLGVPFPLVAGLTVAIAGNGARI